MKKKLEELCTQEQLDALVSFRIDKKKKKESVAHHKFVTKMIKRARVLGLLPFSHLNLTA
jgi:ribosomal protein S18